MVGAGRLGQIRFMAGRLNVWLPALLAFALPLSTSAISILAVVILLLWVIEGNFGDKFREIFSHSVVVAVLAFLAVFVLGLLWSPDVRAGFEVIQALWKIAMLLIFLTAISLEKRSLYCNFFLAGLTAAMCITFLAWFDLVHFGGISPSHLTRKTSHIVYNPLLAFGIYLVLHEAVWGGRKTVFRAALFLLAAVMTLNMFITEGRAGQLAFFVLMILFLFQIFKHNRAKAVLAVCLLLPSIFAAGYFFSPVFQQRVDVALQEICQFEENPDTSVGLRLLFWKNSCEIIRQHPLLGIGTGGFQIAYAWTNWAKSPWHIATDNPHNQFLLVAATVGVPGTLTLLLIFAAMFHQAGMMDDRYQRVRFAFPVFFLTIMLTESYLKVYETAFLFALFTAVLYKQPQKKDLLDGTVEKEHWLIMSYLFNIDGKAASQTITDRIPLLLEQGVDPIVLSGPLGRKDGRFLHKKIFSSMPSGLQYELRFLLKKKAMPTWLREIYKAMVTVVLLPLYLIERIFIHLDTHWSWGISGTFSGLAAVFRYRPALIYSTAGPSSTHLAACWLHRLTGTPWIAELHDPLVYDIEPRKWHQRFLFHNWLEKQICRHAAAVIFFTDHALESADRRHPIQGKKVVLRPGADPPVTPEVCYTQREQIHFGHFGSLTTTRNLRCLLQAFSLLFEEQPARRQQGVLDIFGSGLDDVSRTAMDEFSLASTVREHGRLEYDKVSGKSGRQQVLEEMKRSDVLLILHGSGLICEEYIPSKVYEYLLTGRPVLALTPATSELGRIVLECGHRVVDPDNAGAVKDMLAVCIREWQEGTLSGNICASPYTVQKTVDTLLEVARQVTGSSR
jgi:O-antigen ligase